MQPNSGSIETKRSRFYRFGAFELDSLEETLRCEGQKQNINNRAFQVLPLLVERGGEVVTRNEFFEKVWDGCFVEDNNLTVAVASLRKLLGDNSKQARYIENLPRKGYRFIAQVDRVDKGPAVRLNNAGQNGADTVMSAGPETVHPTGSSGPGFWSFGSRRFAVVVLLVFLLSILAIGVASRKAGGPSPAPVVDRIDSVAVLPFETRTSASEYLADGITDSIIGNLSKQPGLRVVDRNSAYNFNNRSADPAAAGRELDVRAIVTGRIDQSDDTIIISAELVDLTGNTKLWRQQFRRQSTELFATQLEISRAIIQNLRFGSSAMSPDDKEDRRSTLPKAYDLYLKGRYYWNKRTNPDFIRSVELFKSAIDLDPTFAQAYVGLADALTLGGFAQPNLSTAEKNAVIRGNIQKALEIDDSLGEAYAALAINKCYYDWDFSGAESDYRRAIELNPNSSTARHWYAEFLAMQGRFDESIAEYDRALSLDPLSLPIKTDRAYTYYYRHDFDTSIELLTKVRDMDPEYARTYEFLSFAYVAKGMFGESVDLSDKILTLQFQSGERAASDYERRKELLKGIRRGAINGGSDGYWRARLDLKIDPVPFYTAVAYSKLGNADKAFEYLEKAYAARSSELVWLKVEPELDSIRSDPRYGELLRRVGFSD